MSLKVVFHLAATDDGSGRWREAYADSMVEIETMLKGVLNEVTFKRHHIDDDNLMVTVSSIRDVNMLRVAASDLITFELWQVMAEDGRWIRHRTDGPALIDRDPYPYQDKEFRYFLWGVEVEQDWHGKLVADGTAESSEQVRQWFEARYYE